MKVHNIIIAALFAAIFYQPSIVHIENIESILLFMVILVVARLSHLASSIAIGVVLVHTFNPILNSVFALYSNDLMSMSSVVLCYVCTLFFVASSRIRRIRSICVFVSLSLSFVISIVFMKYVPFERSMLYILCFFSSLSLLHISNIQLFETKFNWVNFLITGLFFFFCFVSIESPRRTQKIALLESQWCITTGDYSEDYTMKSAYSYSLMKEVISNKYNFIWVEDYKDLQSALDSVEVLLMMTPTKPFKPHEIEAVRSFVNAGGRLVAIADHTDLYGHATVLNSLLAPYGLAVNFDSIFSKSRPTVDSAFFQFGDLQKIALKTPCSVSMFRPGHVWAITPGGISEKADYSKPNFFGDLEWTADDGVSNWPIGVTVPYGAGEASIFCDSTMFANFAIFQPNTLEILDGILTGGHQSSRGSFWAFWLTLALLATVSFLPIVPHLNLLTACLVVFLVVGVKHSSPDTNDFYRLDKTIDVYGDPKLIVEPAPNSIPSSEVSSLYAHIARSGIYPRYITNVLPDVITSNALFLTTADNAFNISLKNGNDLLKILIVDDLKANTKSPFKAFNYGTEAPIDLIKFFPINVPKRIAYQASGFHSVQHNGLNYLAASGVLDDRTIGNWWITTDISPFRRYILTEFYGWLRGKNEVPVFRYPPRTIFSTEGNGPKWKFATSEGRQVELFGSTPDNVKYIYFGSGVWGIRSYDEGKEYLLGGPELLDDSYSILSLRWAAVQEK